MHYEYIVSFIHVSVLLLKTVFVFVGCNIFLYFFHVVFMSLDASSDFVSVPKRLAASHEETLLKL